MKQYELKKILVLVDDDENTAKVNALYIMNVFGIEPVIFFNPCDAFKYIIANRHRLSGIITDAYMSVPGCRVETGVQLIREIDIPGIPMVPVLFCTSLNGQKEIEAMHKIGNYCVKPLVDHITNENSELHKFLEKLT